MASFTMTAEDSLRTKLREWHHAHPNGTIEDARRELRPMLTKEEVGSGGSRASRPVTPPS
jgi:hypothetical protein